MLYSGVGQPTRSCRTKRKQAFEFQPTRADPISESFYSCILISQFSFYSYHDRVTLLLRLFFVMGGAWIAEFVTWVINPDVKGKIPLYWIVFGKVFRSCKCHAAVYVHHCWLANHYLENVSFCNTGSWVRLFVSDFVSLLQAFCIFVIFVCRREVAEGLCNLYPSLQGTSILKQHLFACNKYQVYLNSCCHSCTSTAMLLLHQTQTTTEWNFNCSSRDQSTWYSEICCGHSQRHQPAGNLISPSFKCVKWYQHQQSTIRSRSAHFLPEPL